MKWFSKFLWFIQPIVYFIDHALTVPFSIKKIHGGHYYIWRDRIKKGMIFITDTYGAGSNIMNPSDGNHGAIYFGFGIATALSDLLAELESDVKTANTEKYAKLVQEKITRIRHAISLHSAFPLRDDVPYVIEAVGSGVIITNLVKFLTTKDAVRGVIPNFCSPNEMVMAAESALHELGKEYDYGFAMNNGSKYCFEVCADAYLDAVPSVELKTKTYKLLFWEVMEVYLASTFDDKENFTCVINSKTEFSNLYK